MKVTTMRQINIDAISNLYKTYTDLEQTIKELPPELAQDIEIYIDENKKSFLNTERQTRCLIDLPIYIQLVLLGAFND